MPEDVLAAFDAHAACMGLSRSEYLRRSAVAFQDLDDATVMGGAWE